MAVSEPAVADDSPDEPSSEDAGEDEADEGEEMDSCSVRPTLGEDADDGGSQQSAERR